MKQRKLANWLKAAIIGAGVCGLLVYALVIPMLGQMVAAIENGVYDHCYWPWLLMIWATGVPCCIALGLAWRIAGSIGKNRAFTQQNAKLLKAIAALAAGDAAFFFAANIVYLFLNMNHPGIVLFSLLPVLAGAAIAIAAAALSHLVAQAAALQEQSDWTI